MEKFVFTNTKGESIVFDYRGDNLIDSYTGVSAADVEPVNTKGYMQNGYTVENITLGQRVISINFLLHKKTIEELYAARRYLSRVLNPTLGQGTLTYTNDSISKSINCFCSILPTTTGRYGLAEMINIELTAPNPLWFDTAENAVMLDGFDGGFTFPFKFNKDVQFAYKGSIFDVNITGDVASPIKAEFRAGEYAAVTPKLINVTTGEWIEVQTDVQPSEKLIITTDYGNKDVVKVKEDGTEEPAYHLINIESKFFSLEPGRNRLTFSAYTGSPLVYIYWRNFYVGV